MLTTTTMMVKAITTWKVEFQGWELVEAECITSQKAVTGVKASSWIIYTMCEVMDWEG